MKTSMKMISSLIILTLLLSGAVVSAQNFEFENGPAFDFGGETVVMVHDRGFDVPEEGTEEYERWVAVEEFFNVKLERLRFGGHSQDEMLARMMAGEPIDLVAMFGHEYVPFLTVNGLMPLNDVMTEEYIENLDVPDFVKYEYRIANEILRFRGNIYGTISYDRNDSLYGAGLTFYFNRDMLNRAGLPDLYQVIDNHEWTWDKLLEYSRAVTKDTDGDGVIDQFGIGKRLTYRNGYYLLATNDAALTKEVDGRIVFGLTEPEAIETARFVTKMVEEGLSLYSKEDAGKDQAEFQQGNIAFHFGEGPRYIQGLRWSRYSEENMEDLYGVAPWPMGPTMDDYVATPFQTTPRIVTVPVTARYDKEALLTLYRALYPRDPNLLENLREEYSTLARDEDAYNAIIKYCLDMRGDPKRIATTARHWNQTPGLQFKDATNGTIDFKTHVEEIAPEIQAYYDDIFN